MSANEGAPLRLIRALAFVILPAASAISFFVVAATRIAYPYDLDFIEDSMLMQSLRLMNGQPVFAAPNAEFAAHVYMPLYSWLGAWLMQVLGVGFAPLRGLSFVATMLTATIIFFVARRESAHTALALACAALYLGGYRLVGFWFDLTRVDSLFVLFSMAGVAAGVYGGGNRRGAILSAALLALAFFSKQTALLFGLGMAAHLFWVERGRAATFTTAFVALTIIPFVAYDRATGGWFSFHTLGIASGDPVEAGRVAHYLLAELFGWMAGGSVMATAAGLLSVRQWGGTLASRKGWLFGIVLAVIISGVGRSSVGGNVNNLMLVYAFLCLAPALLASQLSRRLMPLLPALIVCQFALGVYNPVRAVPTAAMRQSGEALVERLRAVDGEVLVLMHPYYGWLAGKGQTAQIAVLWYAAHWHDLPLPADFVARIQSRYYAAIVSDETLFETDPAVLELITAHYAVRQTLPESLSPLAPVGFPVRPRAIYLPK